MPQLTCRAIIVGVATGIGLMTDKYMLEATNFVEHYATQMKPTNSEKELIKSAMYAGAIFGMITFGPISDLAGRRAMLITCSAITFGGALLSMFAWNAHALIAARIITGIGMGGEYPLASTHSAESSKDSSDGAFMVALLYLFGSGGGPILCDLVTLILSVSGLEGPLVWRGIFLVGAILALLGFLLRIFNTKDSAKFRKAKAVKGTRRKFFRYYWKPLVGTAICWLLFDIVEYGLKQNDAAIFSADSNASYSYAVLTVLLTRILVIPSLAVASWLLSLTKKDKIYAKQVQLIGFAGCILTNGILAFGYYELKKITWLFDTLYLVQLSFQSLPGVTTMAISAEIYPSAVRGTAAAVSAASGKVGATFGSFFFTLLKDEGKVREIFGVVTGTSTLALLLTLWAIPKYNGHTLDAADGLCRDDQIGEAINMLYSGPQKESQKWVIDDSDETVVSEDGVVTQTDESDDLNSS